MTRAVIITTVIGVLSCLCVGSVGAEQSRSRGTATSRALPTKRIDLSLHNADIQNVLRLFAEIGRVNIVYGEEVSGTVTLSLKGVRWDDALRVILRAKGLDMEHEGNIIRVAKAETLAKERQVLIDDMDRCLKTAPLVTRVIPLSYADAEAMAALARGTLRSPRGSVSVDTRTNSLIVRDVECPQ